MRSKEQVQDLLNELETVNADSLEAQDLDFKEWNNRSMDDSVRKVVEMAVCMANGGGGTVVFGIHDKAIGKDKAIIGVPNELDSTRLIRSVYDRTDPKLTPVFEELRVPEGTGRILIMQIHPGLPPYTDSNGLGKMRIGTECKPLTGSLRTDLAASSGSQDFTAEIVPGDLQSMLSPTAMEKLRDLASAEQAPNDILQLSDEDLLRQLNVLSDQGLTRAGLLLAGKETAIKSELPHFLWSYLLMESDTDYTHKVDKREALPLALTVFEDRIGLDNPISTLEQGFIHVELKSYPEIALREAILNALCHADFRLTSPIMIKQYPNYLEISNPGRFIGGINEDNYLHHAPVPRNPLLVDALTRLRLVNRSNLGMSRMFKAFLVEGKEPPSIRDKGETIEVRMVAQNASESFRSFITEQGKGGRIFGVDELLILNHLTRHSEVTTAELARVCQRSELNCREVVSKLEREDRLIERGGSGTGTYWSLSRKAKLVLSPQVSEDTDRIDWEAAKTSIINALQKRDKDGVRGLSNSEIRKITHFDRNQVFRLMKELRDEKPEISVKGKGAGSRYEWNK